MKCSLRFILFSISIFCCNLTIPLADCSVDSHGTFKFIQIKITNKTNPKESKVIIRGNADQRYHNQIFINFINNIKHNCNDLYSNYDFTVLGGGRIRVYPYRVEIYGTSNMYGSCDNSLTSKLIKACYPDTFAIEYS